MWLLPKQELPSQSTGKYYYYYSRSNSSNSHRRPNIYGACPACQVLPKALGLSSHKQTSSCFAELISHLGINEWQLTFNDHLLFPRHYAEYFPSYLNKLSNNLMKGLSTSYWRQNQTSKTFNDLPEVIPEAEFKVQAHNYYSDQKGIFPDMYGMISLMCGI